MRDLSERDEIREAHPGDTGTAAHIERLMGERENAAAYAQDERVTQIDEQLATFGYSPRQVRAARKAEAQKRAAAAKDEDSGDARKQAPTGRQAAQGKQSKS
jgi:hypothetical protein